QTLPELYINSIIMYNIFKYISEDRLDDLIEYVGGAAQQLERIGVDFVVVSANTQHIVFDEVREKVNVPMISIVEATYDKADELRLENVAQLGTKFTMAHELFKKPIETGGKKTDVPDDQDQQFIHQRIVDELESGIAKEATK